MRPFLRFLRPAVSTPFAWLLRIGLGGVFVAAGVAKLDAPGSFADNIASFRILPEGASNLVAMSLPPFEILAGLLLFTRSGMALGAFSIAAMNLAFLVALISALLRGIPVDCGCFGSSGPSSPAQIVAAIGRDILFLGSACWLYAGARQWVIVTNETSGAGAPSQSPEVDVAVGDTGGAR